MRNAICPVAAAAVLVVMATAGRAEESGAGAEAVGAREEISHAEAPDAGSRAALPLEELASISGGEAVQALSVTTQNLNATNGGNSITGHDLVSGDVNFSDNALTAFSGIGNFVINTGHQNTLQGSLSVTVIAPTGP